MDGRDDPNATLERLRKLHKKAAELRMSVTRVKVQQGKVTRLGDIELEFKPVKGRLRLLITHPEAMQVLTTAIASDT